MVDRELVPDVWDMADRVKPALEELQHAAKLLADAAAPEDPAPLDAPAADGIPPANPAPMRADLT